MNINMYGSLEEGDKFTTYQLMKHFTYINGCETKQISAYLREFF